MKRLKGKWASVDDTHSKWPSTVTYTDILRGKSSSVLGRTEESALMKLHLK
jgi:hypothetical protein